MMKMSLATRLCRVVFVCCSVIALSCSATTAQDLAVNKLSQALSFHASFDAGPDADFARGDRSLWHAAAMNKRDAASKGLPPDEVVRLEPKSGRFGGCLQFSKSKGPMVFYKAEKNFPIPTADSSSTISFWLSTDPARDLADGFCDPLQVTSKQWDDAAMFVEFEKRPSGIPFRLGVYADKSVWNPTGRKFEEIPPAERPLTAVEKPPFAGGKWTHVAFTVVHFNTGKANGVATLYLDGTKAGEILSRAQMFTWDTSQAAVMLGLSYIGRMDDLAIFDRALSADEIAELFALKRGVAELSANAK